MKNIAIISITINIILIFILTYFCLKPVKPKTKSNDIKIVNTKGALKTIFERKSVREYTDAKVSKDMLNILLKAGMASPTAGNRQPWAFITITDKNILKKLAEGLPYAQMLNKASAAIVVCGIPSESFSGKESEYWIQDCSAASENILLAVEALGLGAVWTGVYPVKERIDWVSKILHIAPGTIPLNVIPIGYPSGQQKIKDKYKIEKIHWEKW